MPELPWPPKKEDLERLYVKDGLSAARIASVYGLRYASAKTAESTVLYHLKRNGIARRDPAAHVRKVTADMAPEWAAHYQRGESLRQIAGTEVDPATVLIHLHKRGLRLRDKVEAQIDAVTKFEKPFVGDERERAYLLGLCRGDLNVVRHGRAIRFRTASTHPDMIELLTYLFLPHGPVGVRPRYSALVGYEWSVEGELDSSFAFLLEYRNSTPPQTWSKESVLSYIAGLFDAEGSVWLRKDRTFEPRMSFTNKDVALLSWVQSSLASFGYQSHLGGPDGHGVWQLQLWRTSQVIELAESLGVRHPEKKAKFRILFGNRAHSRLHWSELIRQLQSDLHEFIKLARELLRASGSVTNKR